MSSTSPSIRLRDVSLELDIPRDLLARKILRFSRELDEAEPSFDPRDPGSRREPRLFASRRAEAEAAVRAGERIPASARPSTWMEEPDAPVLIEDPAPRPASRPSSRSSASLRKTLLAPSAGSRSSRRSRSSKKAWKPSLALLAGTALLKLAVLVCAFLVQVEGLPF